MSKQVQEVLPFGKPPFRLTPAHPIPRGWLVPPPAATGRLRGYQRQQIADIAAALGGGHTRILAQAPTGAGKTHIIVAIIMAAVLSGLRVLVLATRTRLVRQIHDRLADFEVRHGVIAAPLPTLHNYSAEVQVASIDTLYRRAIFSGKTPLPSAELVIFDEAHLATADTRLKVLDCYPDVLRLGFTATPARKSGHSLCAAFDCLILGPTIKTLTAAGVLVPTRLFAAPLVTKAELDGLPKDQDGDFKAAPLGEVFSEPTLVGDVVANWLRIASSKPTVCFAVNKAHGAALLEEFLMQGVAAETLTDGDGEEAREETIRRLESGQTSVVINCFLLAYGVDLPAVECVVLARPTRSLTMYLQMVGRGLRGSPGKSHCIIIDHGWVIEHLGLPDAEFSWSLTERSNANTAAMSAAKQNLVAEKFRTCGECTAIWLTSESGPTCPECGWTTAPQAKGIAVLEAELEEIAAKEELPTPNDDRVERFFQESCGWYARRWPDRWSEAPNRGRAWAWGRTEARFKLETDGRVPPWYWRLPSAQPTRQTAGWLQSRLIAWAKRRPRVPK